MPLFTVSCIDKPDALDLRAATRTAHLAWLAAEGPRVKLGGPWTDAEGRSIGSLIIVEADDQAAAEGWAARDPYAQAGLFRHVAVGAWRLVVGGFAEAPAA